MRSEKDALLSVQRFLAGVLPEPWDIRTDLEAGAPPDRPFALIEQAGNAETSGGVATQDLIVPITANLFLEGQASREAATDAALDLRELVWRAVKYGPDPKRPTTDRIPLYTYEPRTEWHRFQLAEQLRGFPFLIAIGDAMTGPLDVSMTAAEVAQAIADALTMAGTFAPQAGDITGQDRGTGLWDVFYGGSLDGHRIGDPQILTSNELIYAGLPEEILDDGPEPVTVGSDALDAGYARTLLQGAPAPWRGTSDYMAVSGFSQNTVRDQTDPSLVMVAVDLRLTFGRGLPLPLDARILQRVSATAGSGPGG